MKRTIGIILISILGFCFIEGVNVFAVYGCIRKGMNPMIGIGVVFGATMGILVLMGIVGFLLYLIMGDDDDDNDHNNTFFRGRK